MDWRKVLACITGAVDEALLLCNEYLAAENWILMEQLQGRLRLTAPQRITLAEIGSRLGRKALADVANIVKPETILAWYAETGRTVSRTVSSRLDTRIFRPQYGIAEKGHRRCSNRSRCVFRAT